MTSYEAVQVVGGVESAPSPATAEYVFTAPTIDSPSDGESVPADSSGGVLFSVTVPEGAEFTMIFDGTEIPANDPGTGSSQEFYWTFSPGEHTLGIAFGEGETRGAVREITLTVT